MARTWKDNRYDDYSGRKAAQEKKKRLKAERKAQRRAERAEREKERNDD